MTNTENDRLDRIEALLERLAIDVEQSKTEVKNEVEQLKTEVKETNIRVETYQKASQQVVNLAFGLIVAATAAIVIPSIFPR